MPASRQECPICFEVMDETDLALLPCQCDYQVCLWCLQRIRQQENNRCPQCRREYDEASYRRIPIAAIFSRRVTDDAESVASSQQQVESKPLFRSNGTINESRRSSLCGVRGDDSESQTNEGPRFGKHPTICRLYNCPNFLLNAQVLSQFRYLGKYGRLLSIVICTVKNPERSTAFATYAREEDAMMAQQDIAKFVSRCGDSVMKNVRFQIGAARHCIQALRGMICSNESCPFIHGHVDKGPKCFWKAMKKGPNWMRSVMSEKVTSEIVQDPLKESLFTLTLPDIQKLNYGVFIPSLAVDTEKREWCQITMCDRSHTPGWPSQDLPVTETPGGGEDDTSQDETSSKGLARKAWHRVSVVNERLQERDEDPAFPALSRGLPSLQPSHKSREGLSSKDKSLSNTTEKQGDLVQPHEDDSQEAVVDLQLTGPPLSASETSDIPVRLSFIPPPPSSPSSLQQRDAIANEKPAVIDMKAAVSKDAASSLAPLTLPLLRSDNSPLTPTTVSPIVAVSQQVVLSPRIPSQVSSPRPLPSQKPPSCQSSSKHSTPTATTPPQPHLEPETQSATVGPAALPAATESVGMKVFLPPPGLGRGPAGVSEAGGANRKDKTLQPPVGRDNGSIAAVSLASTTKSVVHPSADHILTSGDMRETSPLAPTANPKELVGRTPSNSTTTAMSLSVDAHTAQSSTATRRSILLGFNEKEVPHEEGLPNQPHYSQASDFQPFSNYFQWDDASDQQAWLMDGKPMDLFDCLYNEPPSQPKLSSYDTLDPSMKQHYDNEQHSSPGQAQAQQQANDKYISAWLTTLLGQLSTTQSTPASALAPSAQTTKAMPNRGPPSLPNAESAKLLAYGAEPPMAHNMDSGWSGLQVSPHQPTGRTGNTKLFNYYTSSNQQQHHAYSGLHEQKLGPPLDDYHHPIGPIQHLSGPRPHDSPPPMAGPSYRMSMTGAQQWSNRGGHHFGQHLPPVTGGGQASSGGPPLSSFEPHMLDMGCEAASVSSGQYHVGNASDSASVAFLRSVVPNATINISPGGPAGGGNYSATSSSGSEQARSTLHRNRLNIGQPAYYRQDYN